MLLLTQDVTFTIPLVSAFYWFWSIKNLKYGPLKQDAGIVSFFVVFVVWICTSNVIARFISICFVLFHLSIVSYMVVHARRNNKTLRFAQMCGLNDRWVQIFTYYAVVSLLFWIVAAIFTIIGYHGASETTKLFENHRRSHIPHAVA